MTEIKTKEARRYRYFVTLEDEHDQRYCWVDAVDDGGAMVAACKKFGVSFKTNQSKLRTYRIGKVGM